VPILPDLNEYFEKLSGAKNDEEIKALVEQ
jgi:hypothetical protein